MHALPELDIDAIRPTRDALHAYARVLGDRLKAQRARRKHWWHASLRPSLSGLTTGVVHGKVDYEIELDLRGSKFSVRTATGERTQGELYGQPAKELAMQISKFLQSVGVTEDNESPEESPAFGGYSREAASKLAQALGSVAGEMEAFRAGIREETSPIQLWPHHFDLSMLWLPGTKIPDRDPADEEASDQQMNFGFVFGDDSIGEPYFYVTAFPLPDGLRDVALPAGTVWRSNGFSGAVLLYRNLVAMDDPAAYLQALWSGLYDTGRSHLVTN